MILLLTTLIFVPWTTDGINTDEIKNKTKRTLSHELFNYGETKPIYLYSDNLGSHSTSRELPNLSSGSKSLTLVSAPQVLKVYDQQVTPKIVSQPQQVLYEYPVSTNTVPNVQVRHIIQPISNFNQDLTTTQNTQIPDYKDQISATNGYNSATSETVVLPLQQRQNAALVPSSNGQTYSNIRFHPANAQIVPRKYVYVNGKIIYDPNHVPYFQQNINQPQANPTLVVPNQQYYPQQRSERPPIINYVNRNHSPRLNLNTPTNVSPITYSRLSSHPKKQLQPISSSIIIPHKKNEQNEQENEEKATPVKEKDENEENSDEKSNDQEEDFDQHEENPIFNKYSFDDYEENDHHDYRDHKEVQDDEDDEEDNKRGTTKRIITKKYPRKYSKGRKHSSEYYRYNDSDNKYDHPEGKLNYKSNKRPKMVYKSVKYSKEVNNKPKGDSIEGRYSENVPVTHKHNKIFREKWYISKTDENLEEK